MPDIHDFLCADLTTKNGRVQAIEYILSPILKFLDDHSIREKLERDDAALFDAIFWCRRQLTQFERADEHETGPDAYKIAGYLTYWLIKLKPFHPLPRLSYFTNDLLAVMLGLAIIREHWEIESKIRGAGERPIANTIVKDIMTSSRYYATSGSALANQYECLINLEIWDKEHRKPSS